MVLLLNDHRLEVRRMKRPDEVRPRTLAICGALVLFSTLWLLGWLTWLF